MRDKFPACRSFRNVKSWGETFLAGNLSRTQINSKSAMKFTLSFLFTLTAFLSYAQIDKSNYALLWEISGNGLEKKSYLFGTMHVQDERAHEFSDSTLVCLDVTEIYAMEVNFDSVMTDIVSSLLKVDTNNVLKSMLSPQGYKRLNDAVIKKTGKPIDSLENKSPTYIQELLMDAQEPKYTVKKGQPVDLYLMKRATEQGHPTHGLEVMDDYSGMNTSFFKLFENDQYTDAEEYNIDSLYEKMIRLYRNGDIEAMNKEIIETEEQNDFTDEILDKRNVKMVLNLIELMSRKSVFCAVGAAHLPGKNGMLEELRKKGYQLRKVTPTFDGYANEYTKTNIKEWGVFQSETYLYEVNGPGETISLNEIFKESEKEGVANMHLDLLDMHGYMHIVLNAAGQIPNTGLESIHQHFLEKWNGDSEEVVVDTKEVNRSGVPGKSFQTSGKEGNKHWEIFIRGKYVYLFAVFRQENDIIIENAERFFQSIEFKEPVWKTYNNTNGAFSVSFPSEPKIKRIVSIEQEEGKSDKELIYHSYLSYNYTNGINYLVRYSDQVAGLIINDDEKNLLATIETFTNKFGKPKRDPVTTTFKGRPALKVLYEVGETFFEVYAVNRGNRTFVLGVEYPKTKAYDTSNDRFLSSFKFEDFTTSEFTPLFAKSENYNVKLPGLIQSDTLINDGYPKYQTIDFYARDSLNSSFFELTVYYYNSLYMPTPEDQYFIKFPGELPKPTEGSITIDTTFQGRKARYSIDKEASSDNKTIQIYFYEDCFLFSLMALLPNEISNEQAWTFSILFLIKNNLKMTFY